MDNIILTIQEERKNIKEKHQRKSFFNKSLIWLGAMILLFIVSSVIVSLFNIHEGGILYLVLIVAWIVTLFVAFWNIENIESLVFKRLLVSLYVTLNGMAYSGIIKSTEVSLLIIGFIASFVILALFLLFRKIKFVEYVLFIAILVIVAYLNNFKILEYYYIFLGINMALLLGIIKSFDKKVEEIDIDTLNNVRGVEFNLKAFIFFVGIFTCIISIFG